MPIETLPEEKNGQRRPGGSGTQKAVVRLAKAHWVKVVIAIAIVAAAYIAVEY